METILLSIAVLLAHFLTVSSLYFNTPPPSTLRSYTESIFTTEETTETNQELGIPLNSKDLSPPVMTTQDSTITTAFTIETQTHASLTQNVTPTEETTSVSPESQNDTIDAVKIADGESNTVMIHTNTSLTATATSSARLTAQKEDKNETGRGSSAHNTSYNNDRQTADIWNATTVKQLTSEPFNSVQTVAWKEWTVNDTMKADEENDEMSSTQATFANSDKDSGTTGSYSLTTGHMVLMHTEEHYTTPNTTDTTSAAIENNWIISQNTDMPITAAYTTLDGMNITDAPENQSLTPNIKSGRRGEDIEVNESTTQNRVTNFTAHTGKENTTPLVTLDTSSDTTNNNKSSIIANVTPDNNTNATSIITDPKNSLLPECFNTNSKQTQQSKLVCFITLWALAMTASVFLGIIIFLYVRLSILKKRVKIRGGQGEKGGQKEEKESLWADPKASVQERVEFWYINGSTLEADRKERGKRREERVKGKKEEQNKSESELWIQPIVTEDDITEFWHANRRMKEDRTRMRHF
ncbi:uncharacterized protein si:ch73-248e21.5 [Triplophysa rosa]|uniref:Threonine-rich GPI-anchored glycoprotein-like n=1 Tax=Triplophysa rosa TaxID=992332 RepID=A0A9W7TPT7_TRIRA|nr:uncharacterized protein si:ch73-248e21.5 [Triplophysa rosa]KAI7803005.1 putative threonine-rich GPI-anchored glycoprotein-like [Triplophysa rosa]